MAQALIQDYLEGGGYCCQGWAGIIKSFILSTMQIKHSNLGVCGGMLPHALMLNLEPSEAK